MLVEFSHQSPNLNNSPYEFKAIDSCMKNVFILFLFTVLAYACTDPKLMVDVSQSKVNLTFKHYGTIYLPSKKQRLKKSLDDLAKMYPVFVNGDYKNPTKILN